MSGYDLYTSLGLSRAEPPEQLAEQLDRRLSELRSNGFTDDTPQVNEVSAARAVLGDPAKRTEYDHALDAPGDDEPSIPSIIALAQRPTGPQWGVPAAGAPKNSAMDTLTGLLKPLYVAAAVGVLLLLSIGNFFFPWGKMEADGEAAPMNGFGVITAGGDAITRTLYLYIALLVIVLLIAGAVMLATSSAPKAGALLAAVGGGLLTIYSFIALVTKFGAADFFGVVGGSGSFMSDFGEEFETASIDAAVGIGSIFGLILGLLVLAVTVFYVIKGEGRILPARQPVQQ